MVHKTCLWWTLPRKGLRPAGETRLQASGIFGGVQGYDLVLDTAAGSWWGPVCRASASLQVRLTALL